LLHHVQAQERLEDDTASLIGCLLTEVRTKPSQTWAIEVEVHAHDAIVEEDGVDVLGQAGRGRDVKWC